LPTNPLWVYSTNHRKAVPVEEEWKEVRELSNETEESKRRREISGLFIPAGLFIGMGIGWALGYLVQGLFIGLGAGFLAMAIARLRLGN